MWFCGSAVAQHRPHEALTYGGGGGGDGSNFTDGYGIFFGAGYDAPMGSLKSLYKPAINYNFGVARFMNRFTISVNLGYHTYKPKDDLITAYNIEVDGNLNNSDTTIQNQAFFSNYKVYSAYGGIVYNFDLAESARFYGGGNIGFYQARYTTPYITPNDELTTITRRELDVYLAPRLGIMLSLTEHIGLSFESKYNFFAPTGKSQYSTSGAFYTSFAAQAAITYKF